MANKIIIKKSSVASKVPVAGDLDIGELAVNLTDAKLYTKNASGTVIQLGGGAGAGDVVGPASSTDNALVRFDGITGKLIQNSAVTQDDNGTLGNVNAISLNTSPTGAPTATGSIFWDSGNQTPSVILNANTELQLGQENIALVYNGTGVTIPKGSVVAVSGAQGQRPRVVLADADSEPLSAGTLGITAEAIANGAEGFVCTFGLLRGVNTLGLTAGLPIYLSSIAGGFTQTEPIAPVHTVMLGYAIKINASSGEVFVNINNGWELNELHNVLITSPTSGNTLIYDAVADVWKNANITGSTGLSVTNGAGTIALANTGVTSAVAGTGISVSGATGAVTITNNAPNVTTDITITHNASTVVVNSSDGADGTVNAATTSLAGVMTATDKTKLDGIASGAQVNVATNLAQGTRTTTTVPVTSSTGSSATLNIATTSLAGVMSSADKTKLDGVATGATANTGTVTSVGGTGTVSGLSLSGTVTTTGNLTLGGTLAVTPSNFASQTANTILAAPTGVAGVPTFRSIVVADVPTLNQNTTGSAATLSTGRTVAITGDLTYTSGSFNGSANVTGTGTLATVNANVGSFGSASAVPVLTVNAKGLITGVTTAAVSGGQYFGSAATKAISYNASTIAENVTVTTGNNGLSAGPITINTGFAVTVQTGANWVIV